MLSLLLALSAAAAAPATWATANGTGDCATVIATLPSPEAPIERLAAARCLERAGQAGRALELLDGIDGALAPYARLVQGRALLTRAAPADALRVLNGLSLPGLDDELLRGRAAVLSGDLEGREVLRALLDGPAGDEARWWLAEGAARRGDVAAAIDVWRTLWTKYPTSGWADRAAAALAERGVRVPDADSADGRSLMMARARRLLELQQAEMAVPLFDAVHAKDPFESPEEQRAFGHALFDARLHARARDWLERGGAASSSASDAFHLALATARAGDYAGAAERYTALAARWPDAPQADEAAWKLPYMDYDAGKLPEAERGFGRYLAARPTGKFAADARWLAAWSAYRRGDQATALTRFDEVIRNHGTSELATAARYWKARATDDPVALREVVRVAPDSGYAWFAAERLGIAFPAPAPIARPALPAEFLASRPDLQLALTLLDGGFTEWARPLVDHHVAAAKSAGEATAVAMAWVLVDAEGYTAARALASPYRSKNPAAKVACLPRPHEALVTAIARENRLDPLLPYAIMNAESGLDPSVTSPAGARGLMQLMPALAVGLAREHLPGFVVDDLYRAGVNARLGTWELGGLLRQFGGGSVQPSLPLVIAGYNGGSGAVSRWLTTYTTAPDADRFAEDISFTETRRYVRRVLGYLMQYRRLYGDPPKG